MKSKMPLYIADLKNSVDRMLSLSFVAKPATGYKAKILHQDSKGIKVFYPILPANTPIFRNNSHYGKHYVMFLPDVISDIMRDSHKRNIPFDKEHNGKEIKGIEWIESFQIDYKAKKLFSPYMGLPDGTWGAILYIPNIVNPSHAEKNSLLDFSAISISGIFSYDKVELSEAISFYNKIKI